MVEKIPAANVDCEASANRTNGRSSRGDRQGSCELKQHLVGMLQRIQLRRAAVSVHFEGGFVFDACKVMSRAG